jgi:hypothetical protein
MLLTSKKRQLLKFRSCRQHFDIIIATHKNCDVLPEIELQIEDEIDCLSLGRTNP